MQIHTFLFLLISIHAPARGATNLHSQSNNAVFISIHAPARGATGYNRCDLYPASDFNPRSREGSDDFILSMADLLYLFQSTLPRGERLPLAFPCQRLTRFQSTLPRGERRYILQDFLFPLLYFNPRSREGSDTNTTDDGDKTNFISIHAPARGATS